jgi:hypothetical protein
MTKSTQKTKYSILFGSYEVYKGEGRVTGITHPIPFVIRSRQISGFSLVEVDEHPHPFNFIVGHR